MMLVVVEVMVVCASSAFRSLSAFERMKSVWVVCEVVTAGKSALVENSKPYVPRKLFKGLTKIKNKKGGTFCWDLNWILLVYKVY